MYTFFVQGKLDFDLLSILERIRLKCQSLIRDEGGHKHIVWLVIYPIFLLEHSFNQKSFGF